MPYSVPPPLPPVVNLLSSENVLSPVDATPHPVPSVEPEFSRALREPALREPGSNPVAADPSSAPPLSVQASSHAADLGQSLEAHIAEPDAAQANTAQANTAQANTAQANTAIAPEPSQPAPYGTSPLSSEEWVASVKLPDISALTRRAIADSVADSLRRSGNIAQAFAPNDSANGLTPSLPNPVSFVRASIGGEGAGTVAQAGRSQLNQASDRLSDQSLPFPPSDPHSTPTQAAPTQTAPGQPSTLPVPIVPVPVVPAPSAPVNGQILTIPSQPAQNSSPSSPPNSPPSGLPPVTPAPTTEVIELNADRQEYDQQQQVFTAEGKAVMRFRQSVLSADRIQVNLPNRIAVAEGNVTLTRGQQVLKGQRFEYNFVQGDGTVFAASGELNAAASDDFSIAPPPPGAIVPGRSVGNQVNASQPLRVAGSRSGINFGLTGGDQPNSTGLTGQVNRLRYEAERVDFTPEGGVATNVRLTNDPFSPPELEIRTPQLTFSRLTQTTSLLHARNPQVVFDRGLSLPLFRNSVVFGKKRSSSGLLQFGFDQTERGGFFVERPFEIISNPVVQFTVTPQILLQRAYDNGDFFSGAAYGLRSLLTASLSPTTTLSGEISLTSLDLGEIDSHLRANIGIEQSIWNHRLSVGYTFRDRLFNGSLGFQNVQRSVGIVVNSPLLRLGKTGINLTYQAGVQFLNADTDASNPLLPPQPRSNNRIDLTRYQATANLNRLFYLWIGTALPPTADEGLRFTPNPVVPYLAIDTSVRGTVNLYSNGDTQNSLTGTIGLSGQFGHFSRHAFDYTAFRIAYSQTVFDGKSPFLFDRVADEQVLTLGFTQQIVGPIRLGVQTSLSLDQNRTIDTVYTLEYSRRTYALALSFSPIRNSAAVTFRISDFNWFGDPGRFSGIGAAPISNGVQSPSN